MPKIVVSLADPEVGEGVCAALRLKRYDVVRVPAVTPEEAPGAARDRLAAEKPAVVVMDYLSQDAHSVKIMQTSTDVDRVPAFVFILPDEAPLSHVLMAVNEGAAAILERPVNPEALANYVGRAISGPSRFRHLVDQETNANQELADVRRDAKAMHLQLSAARKLISYLMSTQATDQARSAMVVSDSAYQRDSLKKLLEDHGFGVSLAANPGEGLAVALDKRPRVVISDLEMEGKNGVEFCHDLKITHKFMPCFFVICTANQEKADKVMAPGNGVDACVLKPGDESGNQALIAAAAMGLLL